MGCEENKVCVISASKIGNEIASIFFSFQNPKQVSYFNHQHKKMASVGRQQLIYFVIQSLKTHKTVFIISSSFFLSLYTISPSLFQFHANKRKIITKIINTHHTFERNNNNNNTYHDTD
jgi:hypothetical protein